MRPLASSSRVWIRLAWLALIVLVITGSLLPGSSGIMRELDRLDLNDKLEHGAAYAGLGFLPTLHESASKLVFLLPALVFMGILLEFGQLYSPGRTYDIYDMLADLAGVAAGFLIALPFRGRKKA